MLVGIASLLVIASSWPGECPKGAVHASTVDDVRGARGVAIDGRGLVACAPEAIAATRAGGFEDLVRVALSADGTGTIRSSLASGARCAVDVDIAPDGTIAVADAAGSVELIAPDGSHRVIGADMLQSASGIAWSGRHLLVSDRRARSVVVLSLEDVEISRFGSEVLGDPQGLDAASDGRVFVADALRDCVWCFDPAGEGRWTAQARAIGERGQNPGQFRVPRDVAVRERDGTACIAVADEQNHRIQMLSADGSFVGFFGMHAVIPRQGEGRIHYPCSVAFDARGEVLAVAEAFEDRVQLFRIQQEAVPVDPSAGRSEFITSHFGAESACGADLLVLLDAETDGVALLDARTTPPIHMSIIGGFGALAQRFGQVTALAVEEPSGRVWVADRGKARIDVFDIDWDRSKPPIVDMFLPRLAKSFDVNSITDRLQQGQVVKSLGRPEFVDMAFAGGPSRLVLLDSANRALLWTDLRFASPRLEALPGAALEPTEIAIGTDGRIAVADPVARAVHVREASGRWESLRRLGAIDFVRPSGVGFLADGAMVVADSARDACILGLPGGETRVVGGRGVLDEEFFDPESITLSPKGWIVVDRGNHRFQRFDDGGVWNLTGSMGRYYDQKRRGSPGTAPASTPEARSPNGGES